MAINADKILDNINIEATISGGIDISSSGVGGPRGVGVAGLEQTARSTESGGTNTWTATLTNGETYNFDVQNGEKGEAGDEPANFTDDEWALLWATY